jgi:hypothetical protein
MAESFEHYKEIAKKSYNQSGHVWSDRFEGPYFYIEDKRYVWDERHDGSVFDGETDEVITDEKIISTIRAKLEEDWEISSARDKIADVLSNQNPVLTKILRLHLEYESARAGDFYNKNFDCRPCKRNGIDFYEVGHNATHHFYLGIKDGKVYKLSTYYDYDPETGKHIDEEHIHEVTGDDWGYIGHF